MTRYACIAISSCLVRACLGATRAAELGTLPEEALDATQQPTVDPSRVFDSFHPAAADGVVDAPRSTPGTKQARRRSDSSPSLRRVQTVST
jgi:hypothetical protein